ncbi:MAG: hypothetical protein ACOZCL_07655 [Bacillota bacterium]
MKLVIIEGLDKTGKTTYTRNMFNGFTKIRMPGGSDYSQELRRHFLEGKIPKPEMIHLIYGEHMAILERLEREPNKNYVLDRSFISFLAYQKDCLKEYGFYEIYKDLLEKKFARLLMLYDVKILYFHKRLVERKDDWLECMDTDSIKCNFDELFEEELFEGLVEHVNVLKA